MSGADLFSGRGPCAKGAQKLRFLCATSQGPFPSLALGLEGWMDHRRKSEGLYRTRRAH